MKTAMERINKEQKEEREEGEVPGLAPLCTMCEIAMHSAIFEASAIMLALSVILLE